MKNKLLNLLLIGSIVSSIMLSSCVKESTHENPDYSQDKGEFKDSRDEKVYKWVKIGEQIWMAENLNYESGNSWAYDDSPSNSDKFGRLYTWNSALTSCPDGWHLPTDIEWSELETNLGANGGSKLAGDTTLWVDGNLDQSTDFGSSGFSALPGGNRSNYGYFDYLGNYGNWWSATENENNGNSAYFHYLYYDNSGTYRFSKDKSYGYSVRCVRD